MATVKKTRVEWSSDLLEVLQQEIVELNHRYLVELDNLRQHPLGSDEYIGHWAEIDVLLFWLQMKIDAARQEIERLSGAWPD